MIMWTDTLRDLASRLSESSPEQTAVIAGTTPISFHDLHRRALSLAAGLREVGIEKGEVVAAQLPNSLEFLLCYLACGYTGATLQTIHMPYRGGEVETLLAHSRAAAAVKWPVSRVVRSPPVCTRQPSALHKKSSKET